MNYFSFRGRRVPSLTNQDTHPCGSVLIRFEVEIKKTISSFLLSPLLCSLLLSLLQKKKGKQFPFFSLFHTSTTSKFMIAVDQTKTESQISKSYELEFEF